jgi:hypothetical protein
MLKGNVITCDYSALLMVMYGTIQDKMELL